MSFQLSSLSPLWGYVGIVPTNSSKSVCNEGRHYRAAECLSQPWFLSQTVRGGRSMAAWQLWNRWDYESADTSTITQHLTWDGHLSEPDFIYSPRKTSRSDVWFVTKCLLSLSLSHTSTWGLTIFVSLRKTNWYYISDPPAVAVAAESSFHGSRLCVINILSTIMGPEWIRQMASWKNKLDLG